MWEADALLDAIFDNPDDDTPRLVYADWLQEHDQENYAEFIRLSIKADGGSKPPAERKRYRDERFQFWERMVAERRDAFESLPVTIHDYEHGLCKAIEARAEDFVRTASMWWPVITPPALKVFACQDLEYDVIAAVAKYFPWLRSFQCDNRLAKEDHDEYCFKPLRGDLFRYFASPGLLGKLRHLDVHIASTDIPALITFADSEFVLRLQSSFIELRFPGTDRYATIYIDEKLQPDAIRQELRSFIEENSQLQ